MAQRKVVAAATSSLGRIVDPIVHPFVGQRSLLYGLRTRLYNRRSNAKSAKAMGKMQGKIGVTKTAVEKTAVDLFTEFHTAAAAQDASYLRQLVTPQYLNAVRKGWVSGSRQGAEVTELVALPEVVQARMVFGNAPEALQGYFAEPDFFQVTVRLASLQRLVPLSTPSTGKSKATRRRRGGVPDGTPALAGDVGEWQAAFSADGHVYYWHTGTGKVTWRRPVMLGTVGAVPVDLATAGVVREPADGGLERVTNYMVLERSVRDGDEWRLCGL